MDGTQIIKGLPQEVVERLEKLGGTLGHIRSNKTHVGSMTPIYAEELKYVTQEMLLDEGVILDFHTKMVGATIKGRKITKVLLANKNGVEEVYPKVVVDASGDGDVMARAGVPFAKGRESDGLMQSMTTMFTLCGVNTSKVGEFFEESPYYSRRPFEDFETQVHFSGPLGRWQSEAGQDYPFRTKGHRLWAMCLRPGELILNLTDIVGLDGTNANDLSTAECEGRRQVFRAYKFLKQYVPGFSSSYIGQTASHIGVRETRRLIGEYVITKDDVMHCRKFEDVIAKGAYCFDVHDPEGKGTFITPLQGDGVYDIPYRSMISGACDNIIVAGRCISATHESHAATRVMATAMAMGHAAGVASSLAIHHQLAFSAVPYKEIQRRLRDEDAIL